MSSGPVSSVKRLCEGSYYGKEGGKPGSNPFCRREETQQPENRSTAALLISRTSRRKGR